jgi:hypothetical protein
MALTTTLQKLNQKLFSEETKKKCERLVLIIAIASFVVHLAVIFLVDLEIILMGSSSELLKNPIAAIYTPFSFILVYEVYLLATTCQNPSLPTSANNMKSSHLS